MQESTGKARRRRNGEGSIFEYRDGWRGAIVWIDPNGKRCRRVVTGKRRTMSAANSTSAACRPRPRTDAAGERRRSAEFLARWLEASRQRIRHSTWRGYESCVRVYIVPRIGRDGTRQAGPGRRREGDGSA